MCRLVLGPSKYSHCSPAQPLSVPDHTPPRSGSPSVEVDLILDDMAMDEEEWVPTAARTLDQVQAKLAAVTEGLAWVHQQVSLSQFRGLMNTSLRTACALVFIKQRVGGSESLVISIHQPCSTNSSRNWFRNRFRRFLLPKEPVP
ncbi:hypothetical protein E2C01_034479 [Portunus trituberculatus]|uniref:Uncharacterized protein n=1 Tax=Portunus trituberculatus TaxID=210409 RepID=A0A5B7F8M2_PORTR|nr:hypothetical protein [Portunus trituberculatus]